MELLISDEHGTEYFKNVSRALFAFWLQQIIEEDYPDNISVKIDYHGEEAHVEFKRLAKEILYY